MIMSDEQEALWNVMQIAEFPVEFNHGLFFIEDRLLDSKKSIGRLSRPRKVATQDFDRIKTAFFEWTDSKHGN